MIKYIKKEIILFSLKRSFLFLELIFTIRHSQENHNSIFYRLQMIKVIKHMKNSNLQKKIHSTRLVRKK
jgi:hypothetical protein